MKGDYPLDHFAVKKIRANILDGNREQARGYYFLDDWVLKAIEENQLFPEAQPDICSSCNEGVIVMSISSCQACYHCSNELCHNRGCSNGVIQPGAMGFITLVDPAEEKLARARQALEYLRQPTMCYDPSKGTAEEFAEKVATDEDVRLALVTCIRLAQATVDELDDE